MNDALKDAIDRACTVMANARDFLYLEYYNDQIDEWNADQQAEELREALIALSEASGRRQWKSRADDAAADIEGVPV